MSLSETITTARQAQRFWAYLPIRQRLAAIRTLRHRLVRDCDRLLSILTDELGKPATEALGGELLPVADHLAWLERRAAPLLAPKRLSSADRPVALWGQSDTVHRRPRGIVGIIGTWNYPLYLNAGQIAQALVAGNAVIWKPSEVAPRFAGTFVELMNDAGFPPGLFQAMPPTREGGPMLAEADIDYMVFTGSAAVGRKLAARLGERLIPSTLELSGCDAMLVLDDADLSLAAKAAAWSLTLNRGQTCIAVRRILVPRARMDEFVRYLAARLDPTPLPLQTAAQVGHAQHIIADALAAGATCWGPTGTDQTRAGGMTNLAPSAIAPTVLLGVRPEMAVCREATFAPVMGVMSYDRLDDALTMEAACPFALSFSIFTSDPSRAVALATHLRAGSVCVNDVIAPTTHPATPFGGRGESGWGVTQGVEGLLEMTVPQVLSVRSGTFRPHYDGARAERGVSPDGPHNRHKQLPNQESLLRGLLLASHAPTFAERCSGWWRVVRAALSGNT